MFQDIYILKSGKSSLPQRWGWMSVFDDLKLNSCCGIFPVWSLGSGSSFTWTTEAPSFQWDRSMNFNAEGSGSKQAKIIFHSCKKSFIYFILLNAYQCFDIC